MDNELIIWGVLGGVAGSLVTLALINLIKRAFKARRRPSSHLCHHIDGAHRCECARRRDHSAAAHNSFETPKLYDWAQDKIKRED